jgi:hypothetical protein
MRDIELYRALPGVDRAVDGDAGGAEGEGATGRGVGRARGERALAVSGVRDALEVGEEHRHLLALAFQRRLRRQDPLGEMFRCVGVRGTQMGWPGLSGGRAGRVGALRTKLCNRGEGVPAVAARPQQGSSARLAKLGAVFVLVPTPWTVHSQIVALAMHTNSHENQQPPGLARDSTARRYVARQIMVKEIMGVARETA